MSFSYSKLKKIVEKNIYLFILILPGFIYLIIFKYIPMYGVIIAFKRFSPGQGIWGSSWVGFKWFLEYFQSIYFFRNLKNTFLLSFYSLIFGFPVPIIFALILNEVKNKYFKRTIQTITYLPHFISMVIVVGMVVNFLDPTSGIINAIIEGLGGKRINFMSEYRWFRTIYIATGIWKSFGWNSIIYLAALTAIEIQLYEAAKVDGATRLQQIINITIPGIMPTIIILLILNTGRLLTVGFEQVILMYSPATYRTADVISTYVYRRGLLNAQYSFGAAVGLFNSVINFYGVSISLRLPKNILSLLA